MGSGGSSRHFSLDAHSPSKLFSAAAMLRGVLCAYLALAANTLWLCPKPPRRDMASATSRQYDPQASSRAKYLPVESAMPGTTLQLIPMEVGQQAKHAARRAASQGLRTLPFTPCAAKRWAAALDGFIGGGGITVLLV